VCASLALVLSLCLAACIVPASAFERASWGPPPDQWQAQGRFRPQDAPCAPTADAAAAQPAPSWPTSSLSTDPVFEGQEGVESAKAQEAPPPLYAWDGGVVSGVPQGKVGEEQGTPRGIETPPTGRMHIIELYQQVLDERDALSDEVELLRKNLAQTTQALEAETVKSNDLTARVAALEASQKQLTEENQSIAGRLVTAQIRRLEAEKLLLETRIEAERAKAEAAQALQAKAGRARASESTPPKGEQ